jgi:hypothetical protein
MGKDDLWNLVRTIRGPFTNKQLNNVCNINENTRRKYLQILCREKRVRRIKRGRYVISSNRRSLGPGEEDRRILTEESQRRQSRKRGHALPRCKRSLLRFYEEIFPYDGRTSEAAEAKGLNKDSVRRDAQELVKDKLLERTATGRFRAVRPRCRITRLLLSAIRNDLEKDFKFKRRQVAYFAGVRYPDFVVVEKPPGSRTIAGDIWVVAMRHRNEYRAVEKKIIERIKTMTLPFIQKKITHYMPILLNVGEYQPTALTLQSWRSHAGKLPLLPLLANRGSGTAIDDHVARDVTQQVMRTLRESP